RLRYVEALAALAGAGIAASDIAGLTVFETDDPTATLERAYADARARPLPAPAATLALTDVFPGYCVYASTIEMPGYQHGTPPYPSEGGGFVPGPDGAPTFAQGEPARIVVSVPRSTMPAAGFPVVLFSRTGAGGDRPLVDRGVRGEPGGPVLEPG